jgi:hypothetical protein
MVHRKMHSQIADFDAEGAAAAGNPRLTEKNPRGGLT